MYLEKKSSVASAQATEELVDASLVVPPIWEATRKFSMLRRGLLRSKGYISTVSSPVPEFSWRPGLGSGQYRLR